MKELSKKINAIVMSGLLLFQPMGVYSEELSINFRDVEIRQIIESVGELTGTNFLIDNRVRGKVTIIANDPVPEESLYDIMLSILAMHGFRAIEGSNELVRIVPANIAQTYSSEQVTEDLVTEIITIRNLNIGSVMPIIKPMLTPPGKVVAHKDTNKVIITDIRPNLVRVKNILSRVDVASVSDFEIIDLQYSDAVEIQKIVTKVHNKQLRHLVQIIADREANRLIISGAESVRLGVRAIVAELDTPDAASSKSGRIEIIPLHYAKAVDMQKTIKSLFSSAAFLETLGGEGIYADEPAKMGKDKDKEDGTTKSPSRTVSKKAARNYTIQADEGTNALVVGGPLKIIAAVRHIVAKLDVPRPQVLIEAIIADISNEQSAIINSRLIGTKSGVEGGTTINADDVGGLVGELNPEGDRLGVDGATLSLAGQIVSGGKYRLNWLLEALRSDSNTNILSTPSILTMNNEEASINVADTRYVQTGSTSGSNSTTAAYKKASFGTLLKVTPQITEGDAVRLDIEQETEDITREATGTSGPDSYPRSRKRVLETSVLVNDDDILVLGGLITNNRSEANSRIPFLSKIPVLGNLFKNRDSGNDAQTLMIFIRPTILRTPEDGYDFSKQRYAELRLEQILYGERIDSFLSDEDVEGAGILPEIKDHQPSSRPRYRLRKPASS